MNQIAPSALLLRNPGPPPAPLEERVARLRSINSRDYPATINKCIDEIVLELASIRQQLLRPSSAHEPAELDDGHHFAGAERS